MTEDSKPRSSVVQDALEARARTPEGVVMDGETPPVLTPAEVRNLHKKLDEYLQSQGRVPATRRVSQSKLAKMAGLSPSTVSQVRNKTYPTDTAACRARRDKVLRALTQKIDELQARESAPPKAGFVRTAVVDEIAWMADMTSSLESMSACWGDSGIGKTKALEHVAWNRSGMLVFTVNREVFSPTSFERALAHRLKVGPSQTPRSRFEAVTSVLSQTKPLIAIDDAHRADLRTLSCFQQVHDTSGAPIMLIGMPALEGKLMSSAADMGNGATLYSRMMPRRNLLRRCEPAHGGKPTFSGPELGGIFGKNRLPLTPDAVGWLGAVCDLPESGRLRLCEKLVRLVTATVLSMPEAWKSADGRMKKRPAQITAGMLERSLAELIGDTSAQVVMTGMEQRQVA